MHHEMKPDVTRPQLAAVGLLTVLALVASVLVPAMFVNLGYNAEEVGGAVMPPGMVMSRDTPAAAMREMAAVDPGEVSYEAPADARGDSTLEPKIEGGTKVFDLDVSVIEVEHPPRPGRGGLRLQPPGAGSAHPRDRGRQGAHQRHERVARGDERPLARHDPPE
jgi:hypothetical protein